jgi:hypothetical protein
MSNIKHNDRHNDRHHFFIGNILENEDVNVLKRIQKKLITRYELKKYHINSNFFVNFIYLGYLNDNTAKKYMDNIITSLLNAVSTRFKTFNCNYIEYKLNFDKKFYKISLSINDDDNYLEKIIIPYLNENAILPIYNKKRNDFNPTIDLIYYKNSKITKKDDIKIIVPTENIKINNICLIKGNPTQGRVGYPSLHDQMFFQVVKKYVFPLE